jgi:hypothetical protein
MLKIKNISLPILLSFSMLYLRLKEIKNPLAGI